MCPLSCQTCHVQDTLGGHSCLGAGRFGAIGAQEANKRVLYNRTAAETRRVGDGMGDLWDEPGDLVGDWSGD